MTGRYLILVCKNRFLVLLILISILPFLLTLAPFVSSADTFPVSGDGFLCESFPYFCFYSNLPLSSANADTLAKGKASHSLLQRCFAPRKVVRLLPVSGDSLKTCIIPFISRQARTAFKSRAFIFPPNVDNSLFIFFSFFPYERGRLVLLYFFFTVRKFLFCATKKTPFEVFLLFLIPTD